MQRSNRGRLKTEYLDYILSVKVVESIDQAIEHINKRFRLDAIISKIKPI